MTARRRTFLLVAGVLALAVIVVPSVALANAGVHGNYQMNTDQCAGCHRAHTAPSPTTWVDSNNQTRSALLLGNYTELYQFCLTCHGASAQGADTNVEEGVLETRLGTGISYGTPGAALISGPFGVPWPTPDAKGDYYSVDYLQRRVTSKHDYFGGSWGAYGGGLFSRTATATYDGSSIPSIGVGSALIKMDCGTCHDVHGSSNYRLLKDKVYGVTTGGYGAGDVPSPYVISAEPGFPAGGFRLHEDAIGAGYRPNYTEPLYSKPPTSTASSSAPDFYRGMSGWCAGCHTFYMGERGGATNSIETTYEADSFFGNITRHRHPVNVPLSNFKGPRDVVVGGTNTLPLAHDFTEGTTGITTTGSDWVECLTCHSAHGTTAVMTGYANVADPTAQIPDSGDGGVAPTDDSALLRATENHGGNNRYVCEACHNK
jgi:predicted CXXCH cytochrome family protein